VAGDARSTTPIKGMIKADGLDGPDDGTETVHTTNPYETRVSRPTMHVNTELIPLL
jgi:hypothetical protein